jgi:hypothetical protein
MGADEPDDEVVFQGPYLVPPSGNDAAQQELINTFTPPGFEMPQPHLDELAMVDDAPAMFVDYYDALAPLHGQVAAVLARYGLDDGNIRRYILETNSEEALQLVLELQEILKENPIPEPTDAQGRCKEGTAKWYRYLLYPGSKLTLEQFIFLRLHEVRSGNTTDAFASSLFRADHKYVLPRDNICPPSLYLARRILGFKEPHEYEYHVCSCERHNFGPAGKPSSYNLEEKCPLCSSTRFYKHNITKKLVPRKVSLYLLPFMPAGWS